MKPKPHAGRGNQNAAKAPGKKRVTLSLRVLPETKERLKRAAEAYGSMSRAVDVMSHYSGCVYAVDITRPDGRVRRSYCSTYPDVRRISEGLPAGSEIMISALDA